MTSTYINLSAVPQIVPTPEPAPVVEDAHVVGCRCAPCLVGATLPVDTADHPRINLAPVAAAAIATKPPAAPTFGPDMTAGELNLPATTATTAQWAKGTTREQLRMAVGTYDTLVGAGWKAKQNDGGTLRSPDGTHKITFRFPYAVVRCYSRTPEQVKAAAKFETTVFTAECGKLVPILREAFGEQIAPATDERVDAVIAGRVDKSVKVRTPDVPDESATFVTVPDPQRLATLLAQSGATKLGDGSYVQGERRYVLGRDAVAIYLHDGREFSAKPVAAMNWAAFWAAQVGVAFHAQRSGVVMPDADTDATPSEQPVHEPARASTPASSGNDELKAAVVAMAAQMQAMMQKVGLG